MVRRPAAEPARIIMPEVNEARPTLAPMRDMVVAKDPGD
jgi:hypothetical protein